MQPVTAEFFQLPTLELARNLLGCTLVHNQRDQLTAGRIVEVEAYRGPQDQAAHSYGGRRTARTEVMFGPPGHLYVYTSYGIHACCNVVSGPPGAPEAILIRALEPVAGQEIMAARRQLKEGRPIFELTNGPGKLCQAMHISKAHYGQDLTSEPLYISDTRDDLDPPPGSQVRTGPRIGIDNAGEARHYPWRFWLGDNPWVSRG